MKYERNVVIILLLCTVALIVYLLSVRFAYPLFQNTRLIDPLAEMHSLFPFYYVAIVMVVLAGIICVIFKNTHKGIHLLLLLLLASMLWYTPYYMAAFSRLPDTAKNVGVSLYTPEILGGQMAALSGYVSNYPTSYIYSWSFINITELEAAQYMRVFPLLCICIFILLSYLFFSRLFNSGVAFLAMLLAIPGLHYITSHPSAHSIGVLLLLMALILLFHRGLVFRILTFIVIIAVFICHPISPLLLCIFLAAALISSYSGRIGKTQIVIAVMLVVCFTGWFFWSNVSLIRKDIQNESPVAPSESSTEQEKFPKALRQLDDESEQAAMIFKQITPDELTTTRKYILGTPFIYGAIHRLNLLIYMLYAVGAVIAALIVFYREYRHTKKIKHWLLKAGGLNHGQLFLVSSIVVLFIFTVLLAEKGHVLIERGLTFIILCCSCITASVIICLYESNTVRRIVIPIMGLFIVFLTLTYPIVAYSIEAYTNFPASEQVGLEFIASDVLIKQKTFATTNIGQLMLSTPKYIAVRLPKDELAKNAEIVAFRSTGYYNTAMRHDLSFDNNGFTRYRELLEKNVSYSSIYINQSMETYVYCES
jgi:hypothetical protein